MTESQAKKNAVASYGMNARVRMTWRPYSAGGSYGKWFYEIGFQEYFPDTIPSFMGGTIPHPKAGQPKPELTITGKGSSWQQAWDNLVLSNQ